MLNSISLYQKLTQNENLELTKQRISQYLLNIQNRDLINVEEKELYNYDDILSLNIFQSISLIKTPLGQKFDALESTMPYTVNPYHVTEYDDLLRKHAKDIITTTNNDLLLSVGDINNNVIFLCLADEVLENSITKNLSEEDTLQIYFPYIYAEGIRFLEEYTETRDIFIEKTKERIGDKFNKITRKVDLLYDIYNERKSELAYKSRGISKISFTIHPEYTFNLPIDIVFKLIHATKNVPLIKYNPSKYQENIYRLYCDKISKNGKKVPYLLKRNYFQINENDW